MDKVTMELCHNANLTHLGSATVKEMIEVTELEAREMEAREMVNGYFWRRHVDWEGWEEDDVSTAP